MGQVVVFQADFSHSTLETRTPSTHLTTKAASLLTFNVLSMGAGPGAHEAGRFKDETDKEDGRCPRQPELEP